MTEIALILDNIRSAHNVGAILRSADVFAVSTIYSVGITPYPAIKNDTRLPHIREKNTILIAKTALGAERTINLEHYDVIEDIVDKLKKKGWYVFGLEQHNDSIPIGEAIIEGSTAIIIGNEVNGLESKTIALCDKIIEIPQFGKKESLNVSVATGIALYQIRSKTYPQSKS